MASTESSSIAALLRRVFVNPFASAFRMASWPVRALVGGVTMMREVLGFLIFLGIGAVIATAAFWYVTTAIQWWYSSKGAPEIGMVTVIGIDGPNSSAIQAALPGMILAELKRLGGSTNEARRRLRALGSTTPTYLQTQDLAPLPIPEGLTTDVAVPNEIAGVEIGWLVSWIKAALASTNVIDITASYQSNTKKAVVFGHAKGSPGYAFYLEDVAAAPDSVARAVAAAIIQQEQRRGEIAIKPLPADEYVPIIEALSAYANYEGLANSWNAQQQSKPQYTTRYGKLLKSIEPIAVKYPEWGELQWLAAEIADRAGEFLKAAVFTRNEQGVTPRDDPRYERLIARLKRLEDKQIAAKASESELDDARTLATQAPTEGVEAFKKLIGMPTPSPPHSAVHIALIGTPWPQAGGPPKVNILRESSLLDESLTDYITSVLQATRILAPDAIYDFVGVESGSPGALTPADLLAALEVVKKSKADVLVFGFAPSNPAMLEVLRELYTRMVVVVAAGNSGGTSTYASIDDIALVAGAADITGARAPFSDSSARAVWAPAVDVPIISPVTGKASFSSGTSYAAAFVGGAAALLKGAYPKAKPSEIATALQESKRSADSPVIDVSAALIRLGEILAE